MVSADTLREAVARAIYNEGGWRKLHWNDASDDLRHSYHRRADAALRAIVHAAGLDAGDLTNAAWAVGQFRRTSATVAFLRALASAAEPKP